MAATKDCTNCKCGELLLVVPDHKSTGCTIACPNCDLLHLWPSQTKRKRKST